MNRTILVGRLTRDPDLRYTPQGTAVANFTIAVNRPFRNKEMDKREADFINCVVWRAPAENLANYIKKGGQIGVDGRLQSRSYEQDGRTVYVTEVVADYIEFLEPRNKDNAATAPNNNQQQEDPFKNEGQPIDIPEDDLPF